MSNTVNIQQLSKNYAIMSTLKAPYWSSKDPKASESNTIDKPAFITQISSMQDTIDKLVAKVGLP